MGIVKAKDVAKATKLDRLGFLGILISKLLMWVLRISKINRIYDRKKSLKGITFLTSVLNELEVSYQVPEADLKRIPKDGAFITVSNHPLGAIDGIILLKILSERRENVKSLSNFLLDYVEPMRPYLIQVNPFEDKKDLRSSFKGIKESLKHLEGGNPLVVFPAGEVSTHREGKLIVDSPWMTTAVKIMKKAEVPIIPIYFKAKNSNKFYFWSRISGLFRTALLPSELFSQKDKVIRLRIGNPIKVATQKEYKDIDEFGSFLRKNTYILANSFDKKKIIDVSFLKIPKERQKIAEPGDIEELKKEVNYLRDNKYRLIESKSYEVFFAPADLIPNILYEIGRLREITFRKIGEGTNKSIDLDDFDSYYHHMFLWDNEEEAIVGAYRMGLGKGIFKKYGVTGFYIHSLFRFEPEIHYILESSIEMGRAFIINEYQQRPMPLFLLWKGIVHLTLRYPEHKYLIGTVSISNNYSGFSKSLMIEFMKSHYYDPYVAQFVRPKKAYKVRLKDADKDFIFDEAKADLNKFDKIIDEIEPSVLRIPVLIKKYLKQNAKLVSFNVDPKFNNSLDGLMYIHISDIPESTIKPVLEEHQKAMEQQMVKKKNYINN